MADTFFEQENAYFHPPGLRQRFRSALEKPGTPAGGNARNASLQSGRKALGRVNQMPPMTPSANGEKLRAPETMLFKIAPNKPENYPDIDKCFPYDPLEFEKYSVPEDLVMLSKLRIHGLLPMFMGMSYHSGPPEMIPALPAPFPKKIPTLRGSCSELDDFLLTLDELTVELPAEPDENMNAF